MRILKALRNQVNRLVNFETANMNKTVDASVRQLETIRVIEEKIGLSALDEPLREVARLPGAPGGQSAGTGRDAGAAIN